MSNVPNNFFQWPKEQRLQVYNDPKSLEAYPIFASINRKQKARIKIEAEAFKNGVEPKYGFNETYTAQELPYVEDFDRLIGLEV